MTVRIVWALGAQSQGMTTYDHNQRMAHDMHDGVVSPREGHSMERKPTFFSIAASSMLLFLQGQPVNASPIYRRVNDNSVLSDRPLICDK